jgi:calcium/calmodulin-dependent protein kinase I
MYVPPLKVCELLAFISQVRLATHKGDNSKWAVKIIKKSQLDAEDMEGLQTEVEILRRLNHPHIIHLREVSWLSSHDHGRAEQLSQVKIVQVFDCSNNLYIVMELCTGGELFDRIVEKEYYTEEEARKAVMAVANALKYCHENNVVHR